MAKQLDILRMDGKDYYIDSRLNQIRNVEDPNDYENVSPELIYFWKNNCKQEENSLVCNLDKLKIKK